MTLKRGLLNTTGILLLALAVFYASREWPRHGVLLPEDVVTVEDDSRPDYVITEFHAIDLDDSGRIRYELTAAQLAHFGKPEHAELTTPDMIFYRNSHADSTAAAATAAKDAGANVAPVAPWQLTAVSGVLSESGKRLDLAGEVKLARIVDGEASGMTLETSALTVLGNREMALTDKPFVLSSAQGRLTGTGMDVDLKHGRMNLHAGVRGIYDPP